MAKLKLLCYIAGPSNSKAGFFAVSHVMDVNKQVENARRQSNIKLTHTLKHIIHIQAHVRTALTIHLFRVKHT